MSRLNFFAVILVISGNWLSATGCQLPAKTDNVVGKGQGARNQEQWLNLKAEGQKPKAKSR